MHVDVTFSFYAQFTLLSDCGYLNVDCYKTLQPTAWIPLLDANEKNGCMQVCGYLNYVSV